MQIRMSKSGRKVELLRSKYVPAKKRSTQNMVAAFNMIEKQIPDDIIEILTPEEQKEVKKWFDKRIVDQQEDAAKQKIGNFTKEVDLIVESMSSHAITDDQDQEIYTGMDVLAKYLRKAGFTRVKV